jgi:heme-degrading monooxygenase HmoA
MIARVWRGWARRDDAPTYERIFANSVLPHLQATNGYIGAYLMRRDDQDDVAFVAVTLFESVDAIRAFAGQDYEAAVVSPEARRALARFEDRVTHYTVVSGPDHARAVDPSGITDPGSA